MDFLAKYSPQSTSEFLGNSAAMSQIKEWLTKTVINQDKEETRSIILHGPIGTGKTTMVNLVTSEVGVNVETYQSNSVSKKSLENEIKLSMNSLFCDKKVIVIDNIEDLSGVSIPEIRKHSKLPIIFIGITSSDITQLSSRNYLKIELKNLYKKDMTLFINKVVTNEKITIKKSTIKTLVDNYTDIRSILLYLSDITFSTRDFTYDTDKIVKNIFENKKSNILFDHDISISLMLQENYLKYDKLSHKDISFIADAFSNEDVIDNEFHLPELAINMTVPLISQKISAFNKYKNISIKSNVNRKIISDSKLHDDYIRFDSLIKPDSIYKKVNKFTW